jgi:Kef-type K+ transport system membrane component KefB
LAEVASVLAALLVILIATHAGGRVARALMQPAVIGEMAAGLLLSPALLGAVAPGWHRAIFTPAAIAGVTAISTAAVVLFMFLLASTVPPSVPARYARGRSAVVVTASGVIVPFALGVIAAWTYYPALAGANTTRIAFILFLGTSLSVTAFPVLARILTAFGQQESDIGILSLRCAALGDLVAWIMLVLLAALSHTAGTPWRALVDVAVFIGAMALVLRPLMAHLLARAGTAGGLVLLCVGLIGTTVAAVAVGLHAALGGFLFGAIVPAASSNVAEWRPRMERLSGWLLPAFFGITGLSVSAGTFSSGVPWAAGATFILIALVGKIGGAYLGARVVRVPHRDALTISTLMNARGLVELVVVSLGASLGIIGPALATILIAMTVITTAITSPLLSALGWRIAP